jgi:hypothetical protein
MSEQQPKMRTVDISFYIEAPRVAVIKVPDELTDDQARAAILRDYPALSIPPWVNAAIEDMWSACSNGEDIDWNDPDGIYITRIEEDA